MLKRYWVVGIHAKAHAFQQVRVVAGGRDTRFLVPQYEGGAPTGYRAASTKYVRVTDFGHKTMAVGYAKVAA